MSPVIGGAETLLFSSNRTTFLAWVPLALTALLGGCTAILDGDTYSFSDLTNDAGLGNEAAPIDSTAEGAGNLPSDALSSDTSSPDAAEAPTLAEDAGPGAESAGRDAQTESIPPGVDASVVTSNPSPDAAAAVLDATTALGSQPVDASIPPAEASIDASPAADAGICSDCVELYYQSSNSSATSAGPEVTFALRATGPDSIALSGVVVRYYFTVDGCSVPLMTGRCDSALLRDKKTACPAVKFVSMAKPTALADTYAEFSWSAGTLTPTTLLSYETASAYFDPGFDCIFQQTNDYSYTAASPQFAPIETMTAYVDGTLVWGVEP